jgi:hypothetical protein
MSLNIQIRYGGGTFPERVIEFPEYIYRRNPPDYIRRTLNNQAVSGVVETLSVRTDVMVEMGFRWQKNADPQLARLKRLLKNWHQWALAGLSWTLALDPAHTVWTTLSSNPGPGDLVFSVNNPANIEAGRPYVVRNAIDLEVVQVTDITANTVTIEDPLQFRFFSGDRFRDEMFWPARLYDKNPVVIEKPPLWYDVDLRFMEDTNTI